ncbi:MAG: phosphoribosylanthranilate isomerase [Verrucomicrobiales bacterium]|nr:phosphoribosylanthranilate isomerase [Verrucomicrobiales bacterium]
MIRRFPPATAAPHPAVKVCGLTGLENARAVLAAGADALGINFWPQSKRHVSLTHARTWLPELRDLTPLVAVLVNPEPDLLDALTNEDLVHTLQLHGDESPATVAHLMERGLSVIKALQIRDASSLDAIAHYPCPDILLDAYNPGLYGGAGHAFPWHLFTEAQQRFPEKRLILSGGLTPENVATAVRQTHPLAVDVASGVESAPGIKDPAQVEQFVQAVRSASA